MADRLHFGIGRMAEIERAEAEAHQMMEAAGFRWGDREDEKWIAAFGDTERELEEHRSALARRFHSIPWWRRHQRRALAAHYISVDAMLTTAYGLQKTWG